MSQVRFQLKQMNGKSQIFFGDEGQNKEKKKFGYKNRDQRFPLRGKEVAEPPPKDAGRVPASRSTGPSAAPARKARPAVPAPKRQSSSGDTVTLTQEQLQLILSSVGKTAASDRDSSVRISVERTEGGVNIEAKSSPRRYGRRRADEDEDSALGDTVDTGASEAEEERPVGGRRARADPAPRGGENILGLLSKGKGSRQEPKRYQAPKPKQRAPPPQSRQQPKGKKAAEEKPNEDMDNRMRRIIAENKGKMKESELVDLLAAVYMEERKKQLGLTDEKLENEGNLRPKETRGRTRGRKSDDEEDAGRPKPAGRRYEDEDEEDDRRRNRVPRKDGARRHYSDDDEEERLVGRGFREREASRRRRYEEEEEEEERRRDQRRRATRREEEEEEERWRDQRRRGRREEEDDVRSRERRRRARESEEEEEEETEEKKKVEAPKFLTAVEKKRLQWEKEREENAKIKEYDPWNRPGAGAPPKDYFSSGSTAVITKKEEEQQRYARELDAQLIEKQRLAATGGRKTVEPESERGLLGTAGVALDSSGGFARGRGFASLDEKTAQEQEERRKRHVEHQEAIKRQVEEVQAKRQQERQRRIDEELREEARLQRERDTMQRQYDEEQTRARKRELEQETRLAQLQAANEAAEAAAKLDKAKRRLQHLETSGHDTTGLRASFEAQLTSRSQASVAPSLGHNYVRHIAIPGLEGIAEVSDGAGRWATPREVRVIAPKDADLPSAREDLQVQTDASLLQPIIQQAVAMAISSSAQARELPVRDTGRVERAERVPNASRPPVPRKVADKEPRFEHGFVTSKKQKTTARRQPVPVHERPRWGAANPQGRRTLPQSEREVAPSKRHDREERRARRQAELLAEMEANLKRVPGAPARRPRREASPGAHNWPGPEEDGPVHLGTYNLEEGTQPRTGRLTPPLPSMRRYGGAAGGPLATSRSEENLAVLARTRLPSDDELAIMRTSEILNPAAAERPLPVSRENTERQLARRTYLKGLNPAHFGEHMANLDDHRMEEGLVPKQNIKNPIFNPGIVKDMPTPRQDAILQHLSDIRKNLLLKQREIETSLSLGANA